MSIDWIAIEETAAAARRRLLSSRAPGGHWEGYLSSSALSTATAAFALDLLHRTGSAAEVEGGAALPALVQRALAWLCAQQNEDGGFGDTVDSPSNISTTTLCWAALAAPRVWAAAGEGESAPCRRATVRAESWLRRAAGGLDPARLAQAIRDAYGNDRTFSVPILTMAALSGRLGSGPAAWELVPPLPFELAVCPRSWLNRFGLGVVSYALPALIAVGQARHHHRPASNPLARWARDLARRRTFGLLESIQPRSGGFLEAAPLTSFVLMSLVSIGHAHHPVVRQAARFLVTSARADGSWPIDSNLSTWLTSLSINALANGHEDGTRLTAADREDLRRWLIAQQWQERHPYTRAAPGGWAWTHLSGGVPDADDTAGALLALRNLAPRDRTSVSSDDEVRRAACRGVRWLLDLQNADGGVPTFCRGWGKLPFDRSSPDLTAHAARAWIVWRGHLEEKAELRIPVALRAALRYLTRTQRSDGSWVPLWFGNQHAPEMENPLYGTARVLRVPLFESLDAALSDDWCRARTRGLDWVLAAQGGDGGWGGGDQVPASLEETALAVETLAAALALSGDPAVEETGPDRISESVARGCAWLVARTAAGKCFDPAPLGLYFAKLWYAESLYPVVFTVAALERVLAMRSPRPSPRGR
ncbi:MAG: prenyltransferase/squalene oxidase repeat-containing protein [Planctomycetota bacterium]